MLLLPNEIPAKNWSFHLSQVNCISLVSFLWKRENASFHRKKGLVLPVVFKMIIFSIWYAPSAKQNTGKELELPPLLSQLHLSCILIVEKIGLSFHRNKNLVLPVALPDSLQYE